MASKKIISQQEIKDIVKKLKDQGKTIVTTNGSFDLLHYGHIQMLQEAKEQGDILIIGLNSDKSVRSYKGPQRPIIPEDARAKTLAALECVDHVTLFDPEDVSIPLIELVRPDVHVNASSYGEDCIEAPALKKIGARLHLIGKRGWFSTTEIIDKILKVYGEK